MNLEIIDEFCMIAKLRNLSEAAKELHITQPVLSRHLATLESEVGFALLDRSTSPMQLTPNGEAFLDHASALTCEYQRLMDHLEQLKKHPVEIVRFGGALTSLATPVIQKAKKQLEEGETGISAKLVPVDYQTTFELIRNGDLDVSFEPFSSLIDVHGLSSVPIARDESYVLLDKNHPMANRPHISSDDLLHLTFTTPYSNKFHAVRKHLQGLCQKYGLLGNLPKNFVTDDVDSFEELLVCGLNDRAVMLPKSIALNYANTPNMEYVAIPFEADDSQYDLRAFFLKEPSLSTLQFIEALKDTLEKDRKAQS